MWNWRQKWKSTGEFIFVIWNAHFMLRGCVQCSVFAVQCVLFQPMNKLKSFFGNICERANVNSTCIQCTYPLNILWCCMWNVSLILFVCVMFHSYTRFHNVFVSHFTTFPYPIFYCFFFFSYLSSVFSLVVFYFFSGIVALVAATTPIRL